MIKPYDYQEQAVSTCLEFVKARPEKDLLIQIPTGGGKSIVIYLLATELQRLGFNTLIITPRTRLVEQNSKYFSDIGVCSGKLGNDVFSGDISTIIGTFQTLIKREHSQVDVVLVDEAHLVPDDELSAFNSYLKEMGKPVIGFTATPFRNNQPIFGEDEHRFEVGFNIDIVELIERGILVPPRSFSLQVGKDFLNFKDYIKKALPKIKSALEREGRKHPLFFFSTIEKAEIAAFEARKLGMCVEVVHSKSNKDFETVETLFKNSNTAIFSVNQLTTGVDLPMADAIICLRKINSLALWVQIVGRGLRSFEGKRDCLVLDFGDNASRFGALDNLLRWDKKTSRPGRKPYLICNACGYEQPAKNQVCENCGTEIEGKENAIYLSDTSSDFELISKIKIVSVLSVNFEQSAFKTEIGFIKANLGTLKKSPKKILVLVTKEGLKVFKKIVI